MIAQSTRAPDAPGDAALRGMFAARKQVFIDQLKWDLPVLDGRFELDQFDTPDARYLILLDPDDLRHRASARLLPTTAPHLLGDIYPHLCADGAPTSKGVWEISRFCLDPAQTPVERRDARNQLVTALADYALNEQFWRFLPLYILLKIQTNSLIWYYSRKYNAERMLFYSNKNISETTLFVSAFLLDAGLFFLLVAFISILL